MKNIFRIFFIVSLLAVLSGCQNTAPEMIYTDMPVKYTELNGSYSFTKELECTETEYACYGFEISVPDEEKIACINAAEKLLAKIRPIEKIFVYVFSEETLSEIYIRDRILYTHIRDWASADFAADILSALFGEYCNYGVIYGYASYLCGDEISVFPSDVGNISILDINLLCFNGRFASEEEISCSKTVSVAFIGNYLKNHTADELHNLITASGDPKKVQLFNETLSQFYNENGISYIPGDILYATGGYSFDYTAKCGYAEFFIEKEWLDPHNGVNPLTSENFLHEDYKSIKNFFEINSSQMRNYQELFGLENYDDSLSVVFSDSISYSYYNSGKHTIYLLNIDSLMHEYIHSLTASSSIKADWAIEGFARYFSYKYDHYGIAFLNEDYNFPSESDSTLYIREYLENIGRPIDMSVDFNEIENIAVYSRSYKNPNDSYVSGSSFVGYLVNNFGENSVIDNVCSGGTLSLGGKNYAELVLDWNKFIEQNYSSYSKYNN